MNILYDNFIGKFCTILTQAVAVPIKDPITHANYFTGIIKSIDQQGILLEHTHTKAVSYFFLNQIIGIVEEQYITPDNPEYQKIKKEFEVKKESVEQKSNKDIKGTKQFIDPSELTKRLKDMKK